MAEPQIAAAGEQGREGYTPGHADATLRVMQQRTLTACAPFLVPYLQPGMAVLDCGCAAGSMTAELAEHVAPGTVVGIDLERRALAQAHGLAESKGVHNIRLEQGDVYRLAYAAASFDVVFSHALTAHLREPVRALTESDGF